MDKVFKVTPNDNANGMHYSDSTNSSHYDKSKHVNEQMLVHCVNPRAVF